MSVCTYDNPITMSRECWSDGKLIYKYDASLILSKDNWPILPEYFFFGANVGDWNPGQMIGSQDAMKL